MLRPELQDEASYIDSIANIVEAQRKVAQLYLDDGSIEFACPPLKALLHIMAEGTYEGKDVHHPDVRELFSHDTIVNSDWYEERIRKKAEVDRKLWRRHVETLEEFSNKETYRQEIKRLNTRSRINQAREKLAQVERDGYIEQLRGTLGVDPAVV